MIDPTATVHPTALVERDVTIGARSSVWDNVHIRRNASIGHDCIVGEKTYIAYEVRIGNFVKINAAVYIPVLVTIDDFVMISAHTVFTNDKLPRAFAPDLSGLASSAVMEETLPTRVRKGATIGANATIGCGLELGEFSMVGMGSVVTKTIPNHGLVFGNPAQLRGFVCVCGHVLVELKAGQAPPAGTDFHCERCQRDYLFDRDGHCQQRA